MFKLFRRPKPSIPPVFYFKDTRRALEYACEYMSRPLRRVLSNDQTKPEDLIIGFVHGEAHPTAETFIADLLSRNGPKYYDVSLAAEGGPVRVPRWGSILVETASDLLNAKVEPPKAGDLVLVSIGSYDPALPVDDVNNYFIITFRLRPELDSALEGFRSELLDIAQSRSV